VPDWYIKKVSQHFDAITNQYLLMQLLNSNQAPKIAENCNMSVNFSMDIFSDVMSDRSFSTNRGDMQQFFDFPNNKEMNEIKPLFRGRSKFFIAKSFSFENI